VDTPNSRINTLQVRDTKGFRMLELAGQGNNRTAQGYRGMQDTKQGYAKIFRDITGCRKH